MVNPQNPNVHHPTRYHSTPHHSGLQPIGSGRTSSRAIRLLLAMVVLATSAVLSAPRASAADEVTAAGADFNCAPGYVYVATDQGRVSQLTPAGAVSTPVGPTGLFDTNSGTWTNNTRAWGATAWGAQIWGMGVLGIGAKGDRAYAFERGNPLRTDPLYGLTSTPGVDSAQPYVYNESKLVGKWSSTQYGASFTTGGMRALAGGAVNPVDGLMYFGSFEASRTVGAPMTFRYASYATSYAHVGEIPLPAFTSDALGGADPLTGYYAGTRGMEGDIAFDAMGNMHILASTRPKTNAAMPSGRSIKVQLITVPAGSTTPIANDPIEIDASGELATSSFTGMATSSDGTLFVSTSTSVYKYDPATMTRLATVATGLGENTDGKRISDLASCSYSPVLKATENLPQGRASATDQFSVAVQKGTTAFAHLTTAGTATGVQAQVAGPMLVASAQTYTLTQTMASGDARNYVTTWLCTNTAGGSASGSGTTATVTIASGQTNGGLANCQFTNTPVAPGSLTLTKQFSGSTHGAPVDASQWTLTALDRTTWLANNAAAPKTFASGSTQSLVADTYLLDEQSKPGYTLSAVTCTPAGGSPVSLTRTVVDPAKPNVLAFQWNLTAGQQVACVLSNTVSPGTLSWTKTDVAGNLLPGSGWTLTSPSGITTAVTDNAAPDSDPTVGKLAVSGLDWGAWTITETSAPNGFALNSTPQAVQLSGSQLTPPAPSVVDAALVFDIRTFGFADASTSQRSPIDGAGFEVRADAGGVPGELAPGVAVTPTGETGRFTLTGLASGSYWLVESRGPAEHELLPTAVAFTVSSGTTARPAGTIHTEADAITSTTADGLAIAVNLMRARELPASGTTVRALSYVLGGIGIVGLAGVLAWRSSRRKRTRRPGPSGHPSQEAQ